MTHATRDTLKKLNKAATRQNQQFVASLLVTVAVLMKRQGLKKLDLTPEDLATLKQGEALLPVASMTGGLAFEFVALPEPDTQGKLPVPTEMKPVKKARRK